MCIFEDSSHNFYAPRSSQQNGVVERKNKTLEDMTRIMLVASGLPHQFRAEALHAAATLPTTLILDQH